MTSPTPTPSLTPIHISAAGNPTYNTLVLLEKGEESVLFYPSNKAICVYSLRDGKVLSTVQEHSGKISCLRQIVANPYAWGGNNDRCLMISVCSEGDIILWKWNDREEDERKGLVRLAKSSSVAGAGTGLTVCGGIHLDSGDLMVGVVSTDFQVFFFQWPGCGELRRGCTIKMDTPGKGVANDIVFHRLQEKGPLVMALAMDSGAVQLYQDIAESEGKPQIEKVLIQSSCLMKHNDWVRCVAFYGLENGDTLLASGGQDGNIAIWKFTKNKLELSEFEFQVHRFQEYHVVFDSLIWAHEGWVNSLCWGARGELLSCSSDQSLVIWEASGSGDDIWVEKERMGVIGGMVPGGKCARIGRNWVVYSGFQGGIQIWEKQQDAEEYEIQPSITGHFKPITDMDYDPDGKYVVTTSEDQTTRIHGRWVSERVKNRWHEVARPQIHGHDLFACKLVKDSNGRTLIVSGAEEKILRAFEPTQVFFHNLEEAAGTFEIANIEKAPKTAFLPALGLSNANQDDAQESSGDLPLDGRLDEDFLRSQTLFLEVSKLYGHVYEIACIATSPTHPLIASASFGKEPRYSAIILWCADRWKNLGEFQHHTLNVTGLEFSPDGSRLLSVSRDRRWAVWNIAKSEDWTMKKIFGGGGHTRAISVGSWSPCGEMFATGGRDKKLVLWEVNDTNRDAYNNMHMTELPSAVTAIAYHKDCIVVGLGSGMINILKLGSLTVLFSLDRNLAHHDAVRKLKFNPMNTNELASAGADNILKIFQLQT